MNDPVDYQSAQQAARAWIPKCLAEIKRVTSVPVVQHEDAIIETRDDVVATLELGGALIEMAVKDVGGRAYLPILIVTEKEMRSHRVGIGHQHVYEAMQTGEPNFKKAVKNLVIRYGEVQELARSASSPIQSTTPPVPAKPVIKSVAEPAPVEAVPVTLATAAKTALTAADLKRLQTEELRGLRVPSEFLIARRADSSYTLHVGTIKLTCEQLRKVCEGANHL